jgi:hypothetical protein
MAFSLQDPQDSLEDEASLHSTGAAELNQTIIQPLERTLKENPEVTCSQSSLGSTRNE